MSSFAADDEETDTTIARMSVSDERLDGEDSAYREMWSPEPENELEAPLVPITGDDDGINPDGTFSFSWSRLWQFAGPGWLMSIAYLDPGNLESDLQSGVQAGYKLIWVLWWSTFLGLLFQILALRVGVVTGHDLAQVCRHEYPRFDVYVQWLLLETAIIAADIQEVVGSAIAMQLLFGLPLWAGILVTAADTFTFMLIQVTGVRKLELLFGMLILVMVTCFFVQFVRGSPDYAGVLEGWVLPRVPSGTAETVCASMGAAMMCFNYPLHSALVCTRKIDRKKPVKIREANFYFAIESTISLLVSFFINLAVIGVFAQGFGGKDIGLSNAGDELRGVFGNAATILWGVGLLASGQAATMTGTFAGQYVMAGFLELNLPPWKRTLLTRSIALVPAMAVALLTHHKFDAVSQWLNVVESIVLPFTLFPLLIISSNRHILGEYALGPKTKALFWFILVIILASNVYVVQQFSAQNLPGTAGTYVGLVIIFIVYFGYLGRLIWLSYQPSRSEYEKLDPHKR